MSSTTLPRCGDLVPDMEHVRETAALFHAAFQSPLWRGLRYPTVESVVAAVLEMWPRLKPEHGASNATGGIALFYLDYGPDTDGATVFVTLSPSFFCDSKPSAKRELRIVGGRKGGPS